MIIVIDLSTYENVGDLDVEKIYEEYSKFRGDAIIATDFEKFKKTEDGEDEE